jgi:hypothetical protein
MSIKNQNLTNLSIKNQMFFRPWDFRMISRLRSAGTKTNQERNSFFSKPRPSKEDILNTIDGFSGNKLFRSFISTKFIYKQLQWNLSKLNPG